MDDLHRDVGEYIHGLKMKEKYACSRSNIRRSAKNFVVWEENLYRRAKGGLMVVAPLSARVSKLQALHDDVCNWDLTGTLKLVTYQFWWPSVKQDVEHNVKTCEDFQRMKPFPKYVTP